MTKKLERKATEEGDHKAETTFQPYDELSPLKPYEELEQQSGEFDPSNTASFKKGGAFKKIKEGIGKIKHALPMVDGQYDPDCAAVRLTNHKFSDKYLQEVSTGVIKLKNNDLHIPPMTRQELDNRMLSYDLESGILRHNGSEATTSGKTGKGKADAQAFVLSKEGALYLFDHGKREIAHAVATHGSVLGEKPVEMAGIIKINHGKISYIDCDSGHYAPDQLDMYRAIKSLQQKMPEIFDENCEVGIPEDNHKQLQQTQVSLISTSLQAFIDKMEKDEGGKPYHTILREERIANHNKHKPVLKHKGSKFANLIAGAEIKELINQMRGASSSQSADERGVTKVVGKERHR